MSGELVGIEVEGQLGLVTIRRERALNALSSAVLGELIEAAGVLEENLEVRAVILSGAGDKAFAAGADISEMQEMEPDRAEMLSSRGVAIGRLIERSRLPWIAAVKGFALGGGCELALCCDFIYAADNARFGQPEVKLGVIPGFGGTQRLARRVGIGKAKELVLTGDIIDATEALRIGLCDSVFAADEVMQQARGAAGRISANGPLAVAEAKRVIQQGWSLRLDEALALETDAFTGLFATADQREGMAAFLAKRPPAFQGK
ncbi:MAG TPA: enoyl-CoA hydratase-related protein [Kofleriaceae bacterium]|nr:enoyl-CoA hydratase-related protein [Kofleriaceae bacterium]